MRNPTILNFLFMNRKYDDDYDKFIRNMINHKHECEAVINNCRSDIIIKWHDHQYTFSIDDFRYYLSYCKCEVLVGDDYKECGVVHYVRAKRRTSYDFYLAFVKPELERLEGLANEKKKREYQFIIDGANYE